MTTESLTFDTPHGPQTATLHLPKEGGVSRAMIVLHEWFGVNADIQRLCGRFAEAGYAAVAVDLYAGKVTTEDSEAMRLSSEMKTSDSLITIQAAVKALAARGARAVGITGFCLGGGQSLAAICNVEGLAAAVPFYGTARDEFLIFGKGTPPILGHFADKDPFVLRERVETIRDRAIAAGVAIEVHFYEGGHAFMREADPRAYHAPSAALAWSRTLAFLDTHLR